MNCKPGDLAIVVGYRGPDVRWVLGLVIRVACKSSAHPGAWVPERMVIDPVDGRPIHFYDWHLRPIRPGDISEEEVRDLFSPVKEEAL